MAGEQSEHQHRQGEQIAGRPRLGLAQQHFRGHEPGGAEHRPAPLAIDLHVVVVADQDPPVGRLEEQVAQGDVLVTEPLEVQLVEAIRQEEAGPQHVLQADLQLTAGMQVGAHEARRPQGHQVAEAGLGVLDQGPTGGRGLQQGQRPEERVVGGPQGDALR